MMPGDSVVCVRCATELSPALDACLTCGQPGPWSADSSGDWSLQIGPITSQKFRDHAVEQLRRLDPHVDGARVARQLKGGTVRVASNLTRASAQALADAFGAQQTLAKAVASNERVSALPKRRISVTLVFAGIAVVFASVFATVAVMLVGAAGLALAMFLMVAVFGGLGALVMQSVRSAKAVTIAEDLMSLPVSPAVPQGAAGLTQRLHVAAEKRGADAERVREAGRRALRLLSRLADPDDFAARIAGGAEGDLGIVAADAAREVVAIAEAGAGELGSQERARMERLLEALDGAAANLDADTDSSKSNDSAQQLEEQAEAVQARSAQ
mgnify:CR=1 FL=1